MDVYYDSEPEEDYYVTVAGDKRSASVKSFNTSNCALTFCLGIQKTKSWNQNRDFDSGKTEQTAVHWGVHNISCDRNCYWNHLTFASAIFYRLVKNIKGLALDL